MLHVHVSHFHPAGILPQHQTGRAVEIVSMTMAVFLVLSALVALFTSWFNRRIALVES